MRGEQESTQVPILTCCKLIGWRLLCPKFQPESISACLLCYPAPPRSFVRCIRGR